MNEAGQPGRDGGLPPRGHGLQERQPPVRGPGDQHVRRPGRRPSRPSPPGPPRRLLRPGRRAVLSRTFTGVSSAASTPSPASAASHRLLEPGLPELRAHPRGGLVHPARRDPGPEQHADDLRGPLRRHVPVAGQQHRGRVQRRPVGHRARLRARRRPRERDRPAARARKAGQRPLGHLPEELHVDDLRPPRARGLRAVQGRPAGPALRRRPRGLLSSGSGSRSRPLPW